jgi:hypothetical protein
MVIFSPVAKKGGNTKGRNIKREFLVCPKVMEILDLPLKMLISLSCPNF